MNKRMQENLHRQMMALSYMESLTAEEFSHLQNSRPQMVTATEMAIQELMRQIAAERIELTGMVARAAGEKVRLAAYAKTQPEEDRRVFETLLEKIDRLEQSCARQADKNSRLALALYDQSKAMIDYLHDQVKPKNREVYAKNGRYAAPSSRQGSLIRGAL